MLRIESETGWWLISHPDHARLAGLFALATGAMLSSPRPGLAKTFCTESMCMTTAGPHAMLIRASRDKASPPPSPTNSSGSTPPSKRLILPTTSPVRESAVQLVEQRDPYAALLVSMHTYNLLTDRADRTTIAPAQLQLLDAFLERQRLRQGSLRAAIRSNPSLSPARRKRRSHPQ